MIPVDQTNYGKGKGNCLTACIASVLEVPIESLPEFCIDKLWFDKLHDFCVANGFYLLYWKHEETVPVICLNAYLILLLALEETDELHAVVAKSSLREMQEQPNGEIHWSWHSEIVHDPNKRHVPPVKGVTGYVMVGRS